MSRGRILFICEWIPRYQQSFFESLRMRLKQPGLELTVVQGDPPPRTALRGDAIRLPWALHRPSAYLGLGERRLVWQPWRTEALHSDLVIADQASRLLLNYWLLAKQVRGRVKVALLGHGANLNVPRASPVGEWVKRHISRRAHWWFAYTEAARERVTTLGYPPERITVVQNSALTTTEKRAIELVSPEDEDRLRHELELGDGPIGLFLGSLYEEKRWRFLLSAAEQTSARLPSFVLVIAGDGPDRGELIERASGRDDVRVVGRADGSVKAELLAAARVLLLPGGLGLAITDAFAAGIPTVSTAVPTHGPEFEYIEDGVNGLVLPGEATPNEYGAAVASLLEDPIRLTALSEGARASGAVYTEEAMVERFADGIERAIAHLPERT
jgi:glycosyltransferase involved in cell wall biosynthesis